MTIRYTSMRKNSLSVGLVWLSVMKSISQSSDQSPRRECGCYNMGQCSRLRLRLDFLAFGDRGTVDVEHPSPCFLPLWSCRKNGGVTVIARFDQTYYDVLWCRYDDVIPFRICHSHDTWFMLHNRVPSVTKLLRMIRGVLTHIKGDKSLCQK